MNKGEMRVKRAKEEGQRTWVQFIYCEVKGTNVLID